MRSCKDSAVSTRAFAIACTAAVAAAIVVTHGTRAVSAASRIRYPSTRGSGPPSGVFTIRLHATAADQVDDARPVARVVHLPHVVDVQPGAAERARGAAGRDRDGSRGRRTRPRPGSRSPCRSRGRRGRRAPLARQRPAGGALGLRERGREVVGARHHLAGRAHLGAEHRVGAGEAGEGQDRGLDADLARRPLGRQAEVGERRRRRRCGRPRRRG